MIATRQMVMGTDSTQRLMLILYHAGDVTFAQVLHLNLDCAVDLAWPDPRGASGSKRVCRKV